MEDVTVETDGEWHTSDGKYSSPGWRPEKSVSPVQAKVERKASTPVSRHAEPKSDVFVINDDSDEDETRVRQSLESQNSRGSMARGSAPKRSAEVIDLTLSSDDERDDATAVDKGKGRASNDGPSASKRMRTEDSTSSMETLNPGTARRWSGVGIMGPNGGAGGMGAYGGASNTNSGSLRSPLHNHPAFRPRSPWALSESSAHQHPDPYFSRSRSPRLPAPQRQYTPPFYPDTDPIRLPPLRYPFPDGSHSPDDAWL